jgi:hypothetical protein
LLKGHGLSLTNRFFEAKVDMGFLVFWVFFEMALSQGSPGLAPAERRPRRGDMGTAEATALTTPLLLRVTRATKLEPCGLPSRFGAGLNRRPCQLRAPAAKMD